MPQTFQALGQKWSGAFAFLDTGKGSRMSELDPQWLFNGLFTVVTALAGWLLNNIRDAVRELKSQDKTLADKVQRIEVLVAGSYVKKEDLDKMSDAIFRKLDRIESKLEGKADK